jgi:hypothetical protein
MVAGVDSGATTPTRAVPASNDALIFCNDRRCEKRANPISCLAASWPTCQVKNHGEFERSRPLNPRAHNGIDSMRRKLLLIFRRVLRKYYAASL